MFLEVIEIQFLGRLMTFDMVTVSGLICALVFLTGFFTALRNDERRKRELALRKN